MAREVDIRGMPTFTYSASNEKGEETKGEREAENAAALAKALKQEGLFPLEVKEKGAASASNLFASNSARTFSARFQDALTRLRPVTIVEKMFFVKSLGVMIAAGVSLTRALTGLAEQSDNPRFRGVILDVHAAVVKGGTLAEGLQKHEKIFGELFINMVTAGESSGKLVLILRMLARQMKKDHDLKKRVQGAMVYPAIIIGALSAVATLMMIYVVPTLTQTIRELGAEIPFLTRVIMGFSDFVVAYILWLLLALVLLAVGFWRLIKTPRGKKIFDRVTLKIPIFGRLVLHFNVARFSRVLSFLLSSGLPITKALDITSRVLGNTQFREAIGGAATKIQTGVQLHQILLASPGVFPSLVVQMVQVGEETGKMSDMLLRLALFFEEEVSTTTKNLSSIIEPILMVMVGIGVGVFAVSMLQPIYSSLGNL